MLRLILLLAFITACSGPPIPTPDTGNDDSDPAWLKVAAVVQADCAGCHNGTVQPSLSPSATYKASTVKSMVNSGKMPPPPATISAADKKVLLDYAVN